jgi:predicted O-linked N-acetylglucosamine transferase (SPINDLY family)
MNWEQKIKKGLDCHRQKKFEQAIGFFKQITESIDIVNYLLIGRKNEIPKTTIIETFYNIGVCYKEWAESQIGKGSFQSIESLFAQGIESFRNVLGITTIHPNSAENIISSICTLCTLQNDNVNYCIAKLQDALFYDPGSPVVHYNLGFMFQRANRLEGSIIHYRLAIQLIGSTDQAKHLKLNCYYGISCVYRSIKQWPEALYYSLQGARDFPNDPDINNQLGVIYTEMRRTDLAENCYRIAIAHYRDCRITHTSNAKGLLSDLYLNYGQMHSYNGDTEGSIECYNKSLECNPKALLAFQNKIMNLNYISDRLPDHIWIRKQHQLINKLLVPRKLELTCEVNDNQQPIHIGFVSGDWVDHPVSFFIRGILENMNRDKFKIFCYSETVIDTFKFPKDITFTVIKNKTPQEVFELINGKHGVHVLYDLSGHTAANRLDIFAYRCAPIQVEYLGYPNTTGLQNMDYRLTDQITDPTGLVEDYYTERLIRMPRCFLNYSVSLDTLEQLILTDTQPKLRNGRITFGCFNRLNKISPGVIDSWNAILETLPDAIIRFKTKALLNKKVIKTFLDKFNVSVRDRIDIIECTTNHQKHLLTYNDVDIALDTFPYSGTTTSCEALLMGVPVLTIRDSIAHFHAQNVTCSILENCNQDYYIANSINELVNKCKELNNQSDSFWKNLKRETRMSFLNGYICDSKQFAKDFEQINLKLTQS